MFNNSILIIGIIFLACPALLVAYLSGLWERRNSFKARLAIIITISLCSLLWIDAFVKMIERPNGKPISMNELPHARDFNCSSKFRDLFNTNIAYYGVMQSGENKVRFYCNAIEVKPWWVYRWIKTPSKIILTERVCANSQGNPIISVEPEPDEPPILPF